MSCRQVPVTTPLENMFPISMQLDRLPAAHLKKLQAIEEQIGSLLLWPLSLQRDMLGSHLLFPKRFQLTLFLLGNRCPPVLMAEWYLLRGMLKDQSARDNIIELIKQHKNGRLDKYSVRPVHKPSVSIPAMFSTARNRWSEIGVTSDQLQIPVETPTWSEDHDYFWTDAIDLIKFQTSLRVKRKRA